MRVTMFWHGGPSYSCFDVHNPDHAEVFDSIADAKRHFANCVYDSFTPCVEHATPDDSTDKQWLIIAYDVFWEGPTLQCDHCNAEIESAYGDPGNQDE